MTETEGSTPKEQPGHSEIADFFFDSFPPGQGYPELHRALMEYAHTLKPEWRLSEEEKPEIKKAVEKKIYNILDLSQPLPTDSATPRRVIHPPLYRPEEKEAELDERLDDLVKALNADGTRTKDQVLRDIAIGTIRQDFKFLYDDKTKQPKGRIRSHPDPRIPSQDPFLSFMCYYALTENPDGTPHSIGNPTLDQTFKDLGNFIKKGKLMNTDREIDSGFSIVIDIYNQKHPDNPVMF